MILLDTNVLSELLRRAPSQVVIRRLKAFRSESLFTTAITAAEIRLGVAIMPAGRKRAALRDQIELLLQEDFAARILSFDTEAASVYATLVAARQAVGRAISQFDAQIAAIAHSRSATLVTRNTRDFIGCQITLINPWLDN